MRLSKVTRSGGVISQCSQRGDGDTVLAELDRATHLSSSIPNSGPGAQVREPARG